MIKFNIDYKKELFLFFAFLACNYVFWSNISSNIKHEFTITPYPPSNIETKILSLGDNEFLYRILATKLQFAGDSYGEVTPLKNYNFKKLELWFNALDKLDTESEYVPSIAGHYYGYSQNSQHVKHIIPYLEKFGDRNPTKNWRWIYTALSMANDKLKDEEMSFRLAKKMASIPANENIPHWARVGTLLQLFKKNPCKSISILQSLTEDDFAKIATDKAFSASGVDNNYILKSIIAQIEEILKDKSITTKCQKQSKIK